MASGLCVPHQQAAHMAAPTERQNIEENPCQRGAVHTWRKADIQFGCFMAVIAGALTEQFSIPAVIANLLAWPIAWLFLQRWLQAFTYRIVLSPLYFVAVGVAALVIAWITILTHTMRVARA
ncbi:MAG TPA: hypothetical protein VGS41_02225, partial [Chthonomonadales bacterium]|nr:hypothetical protein [Chthonomonadales bacterium]